MEFEVFLVFARELVFRRSFDWLFEHKVDNIIKELIEC